MILALIAEFVGFIGFVACCLVEDAVTVADLLWGGYCLFSRFVVRALIRVLGLIVAFIAFGCCVLIVLCGFYSFCYFRYVCICNLSWMFLVVVNWYVG